MEVEKTPIDGVLLIKPIVHGDERGYFLETCQEKRYKEAGISLPFVQDNRSKSTYGVREVDRYSFGHGKPVRPKLMVFKRSYCILPGFACSNRLENGLISR